MEQEGHVGQGLEVSQGLGGRQPDWSGRFQMPSAEKYGGYVACGRTVYHLKAKGRKVHWM